jgi:hypothetical protein
MIKLGAPLDNSVWRDQDLTPKQEDEQTALAIFFKYSLWENQQKKVLFAFNVINLMF